MFTVPGELWVLGAGVVLAATRTLMSSRRRRRRNLVRTARREGCRLARRDREELIDRYGGLDLFRRGYNRRVSDIVIPNGERIVRSFCYHYEIGFGRDFSPHDVTAALAESCIDFPGVWIGREPRPISAGSFRRYVEVAPDLRNQLFPHDPEPEASDKREVRPPTVWTESPRWMEANLTPDIAGQLRLRPGRVTWELRGPTVLAYAEGLLDADSQLTLWTQVARIADTLEERIGYGAPVRDVPSPSEGDPSAKASTPRSD